LREFEKDESLNFVTGVYKLGGILKKGVPGDLGVRLVASDVKIARKVTAR
jgi:hypothetical protein